MLLERNIRVIFLHGVVSYHCVNTQYLRRPPSDPRKQQTECKTDAGGPESVSEHHIVGAACTPSLCIFSVLGSESSRFLVFAAPGGSIHHLTFLVGLLN